MLGKYTVVGIVGSRSRDSINDYDLVIEKLREVIRENKIEHLIICSGGASDGADDFARTIAEQTEVPLLLHLPNWKKHGRAGGPLRNKKIAESSDHLIACWDGESAGTRSAIRYFKKLDKKEWLYVV